MAKELLNYKPALNLTVVGFGQAGNRIADRFAAIKQNGKTIYNCLALNSNNGDLLELKNIPEENKLSLGLGGLGKNPEKAINILEENPKVKEELKSFIADQVRPSDDLVLFVAGLGGGTGTSTIVKAIEEFYEFHIKPTIMTELKALLNAAPKEHLKDKAQIAKYQVVAMQKAREKHPKIGIVVTLPVRSDGPDVLRQVNAFAQRIWEFANKDKNGIAFIKFLDNQYLADEFKSLNEATKAELGVNNARDYANKKFVDLFHEVNIAPSVGGTSVILDKEDFKRVLLEHKGCLVLNKTAKPTNEVTNNKVITDMFNESIQGSALHESIQLVREEDGKKVVSKVHHVGLLAVLDPNQNLGSSFIDDAKDKVVETLPINGTVFSGYLELKNDYESSVYTFYKTEGLPARLAKGLVEEYKEFQDKQNELIYEESAIATIAATTDIDLDIELDMDLLEGMDLELGTEEKTENTSDPSVEDILAGITLDDIEKI
ncbi:cell division protein FtsZ [Bacillus sp. CGMCC 1.60114]|uniref:cell division protein FtsZ n=1 Tax=unclassified Bacillus (in: firmicutes) TaxID=185979 RepID=UPI003630FB33